MLNSINRSPLYAAQPGDKGGSGTPQPGAATPNPGTGIDVSQFLSKAEFGKTAALISGLQKTTGQQPKPGEPETWKKELPDLRKRIADKEFPPRARASRTDLEACPTRRG